MRTHTAESEGGIMSEKIQVVIADDQELIRGGFKAILSTYPQIDVVGIAKDGLEAVELASAQKPDVVLMDIRMPRMDGIKATRSIAQNPALSGTHVLVLTTFDIDEYVYDALRAGASGFLLKDSDCDEIVRAIEIVNRGDALIEPSVMSRLVKSFAHSAGESVCTEAHGVSQEIVDSLTDREREILILVASGLSNEQIAERLFISPATVKTHLSRIMGKTDSHDRAQLVIFAYENGMVTVGEKASL